MNAVPNEKDGSMIIYFGTKQEQEVVEKFLRKIEVEFREIEKETIETNPLTLEQVQYMSAVFKWKQIYTTNF